MNRGLYSAVTAMSAAEQAIQYSAHNLANLSTPAFKRTVTRTQEFTLVTDHGVDRGQKTVGTVAFEQGPIDANGDTHQLALDGPGFFVFEGPTGEVLSRYGGLLVSEEGELTSEDGLPIAWERRGGRLDPFGGEFTVRDDGLVMQGDEEVGNLRVVDFSDYTKLEELSQGYFRAGPEAVEIESTAKVLQGATEGANLSGIQELVEMVAHQRAYDVASRSVSLISDSYQRLNRPNA